MGLISFNNEQKLIQNEIRKFAASELEPISSEIDKNCSYPDQIVKKLSGLGLLTLIVPEKYGGPGLDTTSLCIMVEELSKISASVGTILVVNNCLVAFSLIRYGNDAKRNSHLNILSKGGLGGYAPFSDIEISSRGIEVKEDESDFTISGKVDLVLNGAAADFFILPVRLARGKALLLLEKDFPGIKTFSPVTLGIRAAGIIGLDLAGIKLPADSLLNRDIGEKGHQLIDDFAHLGFSAVSLGIAEAAFEASVKYSKERKQFGRSICEFPMVQEMLVDMKTQIENARLLIYDAAAKSDKGEDYARSAKIARLISGDAAVFCGLKAIQIHGGYGYIKDYPVERHFRDAKVIQVLEKTPSSLKAEIAMELLQ